MKRELEYQFESLFENSDIAPTMQQKFLRMMQKIPEAQALLVYIYLFEYPALIKDFLRSCIKKREYFETGNGSLADLELWHEAV